MVKKEIKGEISIFNYKNENTSLKICRMLLKFMVKFIALSTYIRKEKGLKLVTSPSLKNQIKIKLKQNKGNNNRLEQKSMKTKTKIEKKPNRTKNWFFKKKINKIEKYLTRLIRKEKEKT